MNGENREIKVAGKIRRCDEEKLKANLGSLKLNVCIAIEVEEMSGKFVSVKLIAIRPLSRREKNNLRLLIVWSKRWTDCKLEIVKKEKILLKMVSTDGHDFDRYTIAQLKIHLHMFHLDKILVLEVEDVGMDFKKVALTSTESEGVLREKTQLSKFLEEYSGVLSVVPIID